VTEHARGLPAAQNIGVVDRVAADKRGVNERQELATGSCGAGSPAKVERLIDHLLNAKPLGERTRQHKPRVCDRALIVEDEFADAVVEAIVDSARSGNESGDGLVWTSTVENVTHNRTGAKLEKEVEA